MKLLVGPTGVIADSYVYGQRGMRVEQITSGGTVTYLHHDQQGSTRLLTGPTGIVTGSTTYDAYGNKTGSTGTSTTPLGYDGQYTSSDTGLIYLRARVYDPSTAQFLTVDPAAAITRAPYNYAGDNPVNRRDPDGLSAEGLEGVPCYFPFCDPPPPAVEGVQHGLETVEHGIENVWNAINENEGPNDEGEAALREKEAQREGECGKIPTGSKPPRAAYRDLEHETGLSRGELSDALHSIKDHAGLSGDANTRIDSEGNVYNEETGEWIGNIIDESHG